MAGTVAESLLRHCTQRRDDNVLSAADQRLRVAVFVTTARHSRSGSQSAGSTVGAGGEGGSKRSVWSVVGWVDEFVLSAEQFLLKVRCGKMRACV